MLGRVSCSGKCWLAGCMLGAILLGLAEVLLCVAVGGTLFQCHWLLAVCRGTRQAVAVTPLPPVPSKPEAHPTLVMFLDGRPQWRAA